MGEIKTYEYDVSRYWEKLLQILSIMGVLQLLRKRLSIGQINRKTSHIKSSRGFFKFHKCDIH